MSPSRNRRRRPPVSLALVQHAHQYLITDGYENREGISQILDAFAAVFALHLRYAVPLNLHASAMLLEAIAWHRPAFFAWVRALSDRGLLEILGSAYSQNIMPLFDREHNRRQLTEAFGTYSRLLGVEAESISGFWVPERVWSTDAVVPVLRDHTLPNGGYRFVLLDDRLAYPLHGPRSNQRRHFDASTPAAGSGKDSLSRGGVGERGADHLHAFSIAGGDGLVAVPISADLRYSIPPRDAEQWERIRRTLRDTARAGEDAIAVFADDLERSAGVGPWAPAPWRPEWVSPYERLLQWIAREDRLRPVLLSQWLKTHSPHATRGIEPGTYYELAHHKKAGESYSRWWEGAAWRPYKRMLVGVEDRVKRASSEQPASALIELGWKQLLACSFETAWHDTDSAGAPTPAPWARACASHSRSALVMLAASKWERIRDGGAYAEQVDVDEDGVEEIVLKNDALYAVVTPRYGGRLVYLFDLAGEGGGRLVVGNPADDWNWQEELNQFMRVPRNHPGCFADVGHENDRYRVRAFGTEDGHATAVLENRERGSAMRGSVKRYQLDARSRRIEVEYALPQPLRRFRIECALSPDYQQLLRGGRRMAQRVTRGRRWRGCRVGDSMVWVHAPASEPLVWDTPLQPECGHGVMVSVASFGDRFRLAIGTGTGNERR